MILIILGWSWQFYTTDSPTSTFGYSTSRDARSKKYDIQSNRIPHVVLQLIQCSYSNQWIESLYWLINCNYYLVIQISLWASLYSMSVTWLIRSWHSPLSSYCPRDTHQYLDFVMFRLPFFVFSFMLSSWHFSHDTFTTSYKSPRSFLNVGGGSQN
jgi:hypothetical protein